MWCMGPKQIAAAVILAMLLLSGVCQFWLMHGAPLTNGFASTTVTTRRLPLPSTTPLEQFYWLLLPQLNVQTQNQYRTQNQIQKHYSQLSLLHIPKTGGTSLEGLARAHNVSWGMCLFSGHSDCPSAQTSGEPQSVLKWPLSSLPLWHAPIPLLPTFVQRPYDEEYKQWIKQNKKRKAKKQNVKAKKQNVKAKKQNVNSEGRKLQKDEETPPSPMQAWPNPYEGHDLLIVVRNPYQRAVSEYYYHCSLSPKICNFSNKDRSADTKNRLNQQLQFFLNISLKARLAAGNNSNYRFGQNYRQSNGHWIPQADYWLEHFPIADEFAANRSGAATMNYHPQQHYVHLERLTHELPPILQAYGYHSWINGSNSNTNNKNFMDQKNRGPKTAKYSVIDLTDDTIALIERVYSDDFRLFGYPLLSNFRDVLEAMRRDLPVEANPK